MAESRRHRPAVVVVAQAFKGSLSAAAVAERFRAAVQQLGGNPQVLLGSDGGDGLLEALGHRFRKTTRHEASGPRGGAVSVEVGWLDASTAVVETRLACGLSLLAPRERDPLVTTSRGVGEVVDALARAGAQDVYLGLGGSATVDGGTGMARAWGWILSDASGRPLPEGGGALAMLDRLSPGTRPPVRLVGLCDVANPLTGTRGARVYAAQKGASPEDVERLARGLERLAAAVPGGAALADRPGGGAAGGLGFGILFFGAGTLVPGAAWVLERVGFAEALAGADVVITGEGAFDDTSLDGKLTGEVLRWARSARVPALLIAPSARCVPAGVHVESGGERWTADTLERRAAAGLTRVFRLLAQ